jgi:hypothetical protein
MQKYIFILTLLLSTTFFFGQTEEEIKAIIAEFTAPNTKKV